MAVPIDRIGQNAAAKEGAEVFFRWLWTHSSLPVPLPTLQAAVECAMFSSVKLRGMSIVVITGPVGGARPSRRPRDALSFNSFYSVTELRKIRSDEWLKIAVLSSYCVPHGMEGCNRCCPFKGNNGKFTANFHQLLV